MEYKTLSGRWKMRKAGDENWIDASVPGSVMNDYLNADLVEDPYFRENERTTTDLFENNFEYMRTFSMSEEELAEDCVELVCKGLDTLADIHVNGQFVGHVENMHRTWRFDIKRILCVGENEIKVLFYSPNKYIREEDEKSEITYVTDGNMKGTNFIRKAHCQFGWDWGIKLPDAGIWRELGIESFSLAKIKDVYIRQFHEADQVRLNLRICALLTDVESFYRFGQKMEAEVTITYPDNEKQIVTQEIFPGENYVEAVICEPQLWWPNGLGKQPLYRVCVCLREKKQSDGQRVDLDYYECRIGLRTITISQEPDEWGKEFALMVNGLKIFSMGADYIPEDAILPRSNKERTEKLLKDCVKANFNSIRVWGGAYYPEDYFYDLCDELGLVIWQDLMFACNIYVLTDEFAKNIEQEVRDNMRRIRHHASLGLWCGNNEMEMGWVDWEDVKSHSLKLRADYIKQFEYLLPSIAIEEDPDTFYWLASPSSTGSFEDPNGDDVGDVHYWDVWHGLKPFTDYRNHYFRYCSEFGFQSLPEMRTIDAFANEQDKNLFTPVMELHQKRTGGNGKILHYISETYRYPKDFNALIYISQVLQMESIQYGVEHWRRNRGRCMGAIYWQLNDNWPVISWSSIDYFGRWKALHYGAKRFFSPVMISILNEGRQISVYTHNETKEGLRGKITLLLKRKDFNTLERMEQEIWISPLSAKCEMMRDYSNLILSVEEERSCFVECMLEIDGRVVSKQTALFVPPKYFEFVPPKYYIEVTELQDTVSIFVKADTYTRFAEVKIEDEDLVFSDNYVDITDETGIVVSLEKKDLNSLENLKERVHVYSIGDSYTGGSL